MILNLHYTMLLPVLTKQLGMNFYVCCKK